MTVIMMIMMIARIPMPYRVAGKIIAMRLPIDQG